MMSSSEVVQYGLMALVAAVLLQRVVTKVIARRKIPGLLQGGAVIIDVRSPGEFSAGSAVGSRNIPLPDLEPAVAWRVAGCSSMDSDMFSMAVRGETCRDCEHRDPSVRRRLTGTQRSTLR